MKEILDNPQQIWQSQPVEGTKMSVKAIRLRAGNFERTIVRRNLRETIIAVLVIAFFGYSLATAPQVLLRITWGLFIAGMVWITINLHRRGTPKTMPADMGKSSCLEFFRSELERQRDLIQNVWPWHLAPLVPGYLALNIAYIFGSHRLVLWAGLALINVVFVAAFAGVWKVNQRAARCLQRSIDELNSAESAR